jgi:hypothetical protein
MNTTKITIFFALVVLLSAGALPPLTWSTICASCVPNCALSGPFYVPCMIACCGIGPATSFLTACFANDTIIISKQGPIFLEDAQVGDLVLTENS